MSVLIRGVGERLDEWLGRGLLVGEPAGEETALGIGAHQLQRPR